MNYESRRYRKNDWWDLVVVIDQELERSKSYETYFYIVDELKWRIVDSVSEGGDFKIRSKAENLLASFKVNCSDKNTLTEVQKNDIYAIFDLILSTKNGEF